MAKPLFSITVSKTEMSWSSVGNEGHAPLFTVAQWAEMENQALIFKYLKAGLPVPSELLAPIRTSFNLISPNFLRHHPTLASYSRKKMDPEPGRCRRTDGKKWRCSKDAHPESKYCERHMNRGRYRSRKLVESQTSSQSLSTVTSDSVIGICSHSGSFQSMPLHSMGNSGALCFGSNASELKMESIPYGVSNRGTRYIHYATFVLVECLMSLRCNPIIPIGREAFLLHNLCRIAYFPNNTDQGLRCERLSNPSDATGGDLNREALG
ncbi:hypothetical protein TB2_022628 [Malus domestica]